MARTFPWISPRRVPSVPSYQNLGPKLTSCCLTYASRFPLVSLIPKVSLMASIFWSMMYCVPLNGVFHPGVWPMVCGLVAWSDMGAPHRPQKRLPGTRGWPQEEQTGLVINSESRVAGCSGPKRELCPLKRRGGEALMRREVESLRPLFFPEHLLSGSDYGREMLIRARSGHLSVRNYPRLQREISRVLDIPVQITN